MEGPLVGRPLRRALLALTSADTTNLETAGRGQT